MSSEPNQNSWKIIEDVEVAFDGFRRIIETLEI
jgi:hypothetical protein